MSPVAAARDGWTVEARETRAQEMAATTAQHLAFAVAQRSADLIGQLLLPLSRQDLVTLAVVLADQVPAARTRPEDGIVDDIAVERAAKGEVLPLTKVERDKAIRRMARRGVALHVIAAQFEVSVKTVKRALAPRPVQTRLRVPPAQTGRRRPAGKSSGGAVA